MHRDDIGTGLGEVRHTELGLHNHEMAIQHFVSDGAESIHNQRANGDVGDKTTIHDINVDPIATGLVNCLDLHTSN